MKIKIIILVKCNIVKTRHFILNFEDIDFFSKTLIDSGTFITFYNQSINKKFRAFDSKPSFRVAPQNNSSQGSKGIRQWR